MQIYPLTKAGDNANTYTDNLDQQKVYIIWGEQTTLYSVAT